MRGYLGGPGGNRQRNKRHRDGNRGGGGQGGGNVNGNKVYGRWPGLQPNQLDSGDLAVTTDYRQVLSEILAKRRGETNLASVFPTVTYAPLGIVN